MTAPKEQFFVRRRCEYEKSNNVVNSSFNLASGGVTRFCPNHFFNRWSFPNRIFYPKCNSGNDRFGRSRIGWIFCLGGFGYITSSGNPEKLDQSKKTILYSAIGLAIVLGAFVLSSIVTQLATAAFGAGH